MAKRLFDVVAGGALSLLALPVMVAVAIALKLEGRVPVFRRTPRVGKGGRIFHMVSFSTMAGHEAGRGATPEERQTSVGRFIRNYSLDHLPMLWHVVRGDMSLIGPRPMEPERVELGDPGWRRIVSVRPGAASYAILRLARAYNRSPMAEKMRLELEYVDRHSLAFDFALFAEILRAQVTSRGNIKARGEPTVARDRTG